MTKAKLTDQDFLDAANKIGCQAAAVKAVAKVETRGAAFLPSGLPTILFERHKFSKYTGGHFDKDYSDISNRTPGGYLGGEAEHKRLEKAAMLNREAALKSASWGMFQIMGFNWDACGYSSLQDFINDMYAGEPGHLRAFVGFVKNDSVMGAALRNTDWAAFARRYNGENYAINRYDIKMAHEYLEAGGR